MGFDWERYCLQWLTLLGVVGMVWPLIGIVFDIIIYGPYRKVGPTEWQNKQGD